MKNFLMSLLLLGATSTMFAATPPFAGEIDVEKSTVVWVGKKVTGKHNGTIKLKEGSVQMADDKLTGGSFVIDMTSLMNTDMAGSDGQAKLEGHLKSEDFFNVAAHPTATLVITDVAARGTEGSYKVTADLTIKGTTKPVKFNAQFASENGRTSAIADIIVDRSEYDVRYGSGSFFENLGDKTIYDEFELQVSLVLK